MGVASLWGNVINFEGTGVWVDLGNFSRRWERSSRESAVRGHPQKSVENVIAPSGPTLWICQCDPRQLKTRVRARQGKRMPPLTREKHDVALTNFHLFESISAFLVKVRWQYPRQRHNVEEMIQQRSCQWGPGDLGRSKRIPGKRIVQRRQLHGSGCIHSEQRSVEPVFKTS